jgi:flagellar capping protein FliD
MPHSKQMIQDPFGLDAQIARARDGMGTSKPQERVNKLAQRYADEIDRLASKEAKMRRAFKAWDAQRAIVARMEKQLDKLEA